MFSGSDPIGKAARRYAMDNELDMAVMYDPGSRPCGALFQYLVPEKQRTDLGLVRERTVAVNIAYKGLTAVLKKSAEVLLKEMRSATEKRE